MSKSLHFKFYSISLVRFNLIITYNVQLLLKICKSTKIIGRLYPMCKLYFVHI